MYLEASSCSGLNSQILPVRPCLAHTVKFYRHPFTPHPLPFLTMFTFKRTYCALLDLDPILWPRAAASAEVFWTGPTHPNGGPLNVSEALARLHDLRYRYVQRGVNAIALQPEWCAVRPHACDF